MDFKFTVCAFFINSIKQFKTDKIFSDLDRAEFYLSNLKKLIENKNYKYKRSQRKDFFMSGLKQLIEKQNDENIQLKRKNSTLETENINLARIIKKFVKYLYFKLILFYIKRIL